MPQCTLASLNPVFVYFWAFSPMVYVIIDAHRYNFVWAVQRSPLKVFYIFKPPTKSNLYFSLSFFIFLGSWPGQVLLSLIRQRNDVSLLRRWSKPTDHSIPNASISIGISPTLGINDITACTLNSLPCSKIAPITDEQQISSVLQNGLV